MNPAKLILVVAGVPTKICESFTQRFVDDLSAQNFVNASLIVSWIPLPPLSAYTKEYSIRLYDRLVKKLSETQPSDQHSLLRNTRFVLLYANKKDGSEANLFLQFGSEALVVPFGVSEIWSKPLNTRNQRNDVINLLIKDGQAALKHAKKLLTIIEKEVGDRDNSTCLLLPPKNFGQKAIKIQNCVKEACLCRVPNIEDVFKKKLRKISDSMKSVRERQERYFEGSGGIVYRSPPKARLRHGIAPTWDDADHDSTCVIRGRIRFGASFDPKFHYDCNIGRRTNRTFASCHGTKTVAKRTTHFNISPNDNIR